MVDVSGVLIPAGVAHLTGRAWSPRRGRRGWLLAAAGLIGGAASAAGHGLAEAINELVMSVALTSYSRQPRQ